MSSRKKSALIRMAGFICYSLCFFSTTSFSATTLTLDDAIALAVRDNPNVVISRLDHTLQKFNVEVEEWQFKPHYNMQASASYSQSRISGLTPFGSHVYSVQPSASLKTFAGTEIQTTFNNNYSGHYNPGLSLQVSQPLLRGFGPSVVEAALQNAKDSEIISRLAIEETLRRTVSAVINAYLDVMMAERLIAIDEDTLKRANVSIKQTQLFIKAGHKPGNEIVAVKANAMSARSQLANDKNNLSQARFNLLTAIGLDPNAAVQFAPLAVSALIKQYTQVSASEAKKIILRNDIQYQTDNITLHGATKRNVLTAEDNTRWELNFTANTIVGGASGGGQNAGFNSLYNGLNQSGNAALVLQIPIDDQASKQAVMGARIALREAEIALRQEKWQKESDAMNGVNAVTSAKEALGFARDADTLAKKNYDITVKKYLHGLIDSMEWQTAQNELMQSQQASLGAEMNYLRALVDEDLLLGKTLVTWHIPIRM